MKSYSNLYTIYTKVLKKSNLIISPIKAIRSTRRNTLINLTDGHLYIKKLTSKKYNPELNKYPFQTQYKIIGLASIKKKKKKN